MKKLLVTLACASIGVMANAAAFSWTAPNGRLFDGMGNATANRYSGTGYLFNEATVSQAAITAAFTSEGGVATKLNTALSENTFSSGRATTASSFSGPDASFNAYFVVIGVDADGNDAIYISDTVAANYAAVGEGEVTFGNQNDYSSIGFKDAYAGYSSAGWYTAVPEPTSGLLLLLGVAGLALKRKRA